MITHSKFSLDQLLKSIPEVVIDFEMKVFKVVTVNGEKRHIDVYPLYRLTLCEHRDDLKDIKLKDYNEVFYGKQITTDDLGDLYTNIFELDLDKVPLITNTFTEIASWRLRFGK